MYYAISGMGAVCNTINPRLLPDDIAYIIDHAEDGVVFTDPLFLPIIAAIIMWQIKKSESPFLDDHGREATNFQISMAIYTVVLIPLLILITCGLALILTIPAAILLLVLNIVGCVLAAKAAHRGEYYRYPMSIRVV